MLTIEWKGLMVIITLYMLAQNAEGNEAFRELSFMVSLAGTLQHTGYYGNWAAAIQQT